MTTQQKITTHLWFDTQAVEAAEFYTSLFKESSIKSKVVLQDTPSGNTDIVTIDLLGYEISMISAGPLFKLNPSISFMIPCTTKAEVEALWAGLSAEGMALVPLGEYPFSPLFGWVMDKFGVSWQLSLSSDLTPAQRLIPLLMFVGAQCGRAEEAVKFYTSIFRQSSIGTVMHYGDGEAPDQPGTVKYADFTLEGLAFSAMDSAQAHEFAFNEAISIMVYCDTQAEIDHYWDALSADPGAEQCGWLKDKFGVSWQIVPTAMNEMMNADDPARLARVTEAFLKMKKFDLATLQLAYEG
jgi:predicted 3-demethylubiquinone-9 3-methyltransferase (glyoxalase superfamily)